MMDLETNNIVFVYGTLRTGYGNNGLMRDGGAELMGPGLTVEKYAMYANGIPFVSPLEHISRITGELFGVSDELLQRIDVLEGHPQWYMRRLVPIFTTEVNNFVGDELPTTTAWMYFNHHPKGILIPSGDYDDSLMKKYLDGLRGY